jgi:cell division protein FtsZ
MSNPLQFDIPTTSTSIIKVMGVGGAGSNAVNYMFNNGVRDVEFIVCNTDAQALKNSPVNKKVQIGATLTQGLGAGTNPEVGKNAALETKDEIRDYLSNSTKMLFITAGMGGGTGTGAAPVIAKVAKDLDILTVGIVTMPFTFEGKKKMEFAEKGVAEMKEHCDTVIVIVNDKIREIFGSMNFKQAFGQADMIVSNAARSIADIISQNCLLNVDFADVNTIMKNAKSALMGSATSAGEGRALKAAEAALNSPLLNNVDIKGAKKVLVSIMVGNEETFQMDEFSDINNFFTDKTGDDILMKSGLGVDNTLAEDEIRVTIIATGFEERERDEKNQELEEKLNTTVIDLESGKKVDLAQYEKEKLEKNPELVDSLINPIVETVSNEPIVKIDMDGNLITETASNNNESEIEKEERIKKELLAKQSKERIERIKRLSNGNVSYDEKYKQMAELPAYKRLNVTLTETPSSDTKNVSRFSLNDDNELLGNNRFLHDNVD